MQEPEWLAGACHCGAVEFRVRPRTRTAYDCNCSICTKKGYLHVIVAAEDFELLAGHEALQTYTFNTGVAKHHFCRHCGVQPFYVPRSHPEGFSTNLRCLDREVMATFAIAPFDGANWEASIDGIR